MQRFLTNRFEIQRVLRHSRSTVSFRGLDRWDDDKPVFVKRLRSGTYHPDARLRDRIVRLRGLRHPFLANMYEASLTPGKDFYGTRTFVDGPLLGTCDPRSKDALAAALVSACVLLESLDVVHGRLKPPNVVVMPDDSVVLLDGGFPPAVSEDDRTSLSFVAPEVLSGVPPGFESDLYSLGALLHRIYSGRDLFEDPDPAMLRHKCLCATPVSLRERCGLSEGLSDAVDGLLLKQPVLRRGAFERLKNLFPSRLNPASRAPFTGRSAEQVRAVEGLKIQMRGLNLVAIEGEIGSGKTRLLEHLRSLASFEGRHLIIGRSFERDDRQFEPIIQILEQRLRRKDGKLERWIRDHARAYSESLRLLLPEADTLPELPAPSPGPPAQGKLVADLVGSIISLAAMDPSWTLAMDDAHWADEGTLEVLEQLSWRAGEANVRMLISLRRGPGGNAIRALLGRLQDSGRIHLDRVTLSPLHPKEAREMAARLAIDDTTVSWVVHNAGGNPLFIEECARYGKSRLKRLPRRLTDVLLQEFRQCAPPERAAAQILSLFPKPIDRDLVLRILARLPNVSGAQIERLLEGGLLVQAGDRLAFRHDGIRQAIYRRVGKTRRKVLHGLIYSFLETMPRDWGCMAHHAERAGDFFKAVVAYRKAANERIRYGDYRTAIELLSIGRKVAQQSEIEVPIGIDLTYAQCLVVVGRREQAREMLQGSRSHITLTPDESAKLHTLLSSCCVDIPKDCLHYSLAAIQNLPTASRHYPTALINLARAYAMSGQTRDAKNCLAEAEAKTEIHSRGLGDWLAAKGMILVALCDYSGALTVLTVSQPRRAFTAPALSNRAVCLEHLGRLTEARRHQERALALSREYGFLFGELLSLSNLGAFYTKLGDFAKADHSFRAASNLSQRIRIYDSASLTNLPSLAADEAILLMERGRYAPARQRIASALRQLESDDTSQRAIWTAIKAAEVYGRTGEAENAARALRRVEQSELFHCDFFTVERALISTADSGRPDGSRVEHLEECLKLTNELKTLHQRCRVLIELGMILAVTGQRARARECLTEARSLASRHGYRPLDARIGLAEGLAADADKDQTRLLFQAHRHAARVGLSELAAQCAFRLGQAYALQGSLRSARDCLRKSTAAVDALSAELPAAVSKRYRRSEWRAEATSALGEVEARLHHPAAQRGSAPRAGQDHDLFGLTYRTAVRMNRAAGVDALVAVIREALGGSPQGSAVIFLDVRSKREFHAGDERLDEETMRSIVKFHRTASAEPFVAATPHRHGTRKSAEKSIAWIPLTFQRHRFGGLYVVLSRGFTEREIEYLTTVAMNASTALAALLWSTEKTPVPRAAPRFAGLVGSSPAIEGICSQIEIAARSQATVLVEGESGTGKELAARAIHDNSPRSQGPFIAVDCGAIPETLIESELFGSRRGSFTGATTDRMGLIEASNEGTLFLDEISNTSPSLQAKLLRVLQEREVRRLGDTNGRKVDLRLIAATNADLDVLVEKSAFRQDLLYRLKVLHIVIPPLRQRREDIPELAQEFLNRLNQAHGTRKRFHKSALSSLMAGTYKGNVRELQNVIERAYFSTAGREVITEVAGSDAAAVRKSADVETCFRRLTEGRDTFWNAVHAPYKSRDISREKVLALMDMGLRMTKGSYKNLAALLQVGEAEYRRFMDFIRRNKCQPDFRPYRRPGRLSPGQTGEAGPAQRSI